MSTTLRIWFILVVRSLKLYLCLIFKNIFYSFFSLLFSLLFIIFRDKSESETSFFDILFIFIYTCNNIDLNMNRLFVQNFYMKTIFSFYFWLFSLFHWAWKIVNIKKKTEWGPWKCQIQAHSNWDQYMLFNFYNNNF